LHVGTSLGQAFFPKFDLPGISAKFKSDLLDKFHIISDKHDFLTLIPMLCLT